MMSEISSHNSQAGLSKNKRYLILIAVAIGTFMGPLDSSVVNIALPSISDYFNTSLGSVEWVVISYLLMISSLLLTYGRLGDMYGHKRIYILGFIIFTLGSLICALSPTILILIIFRGIQAIGAGMMMAMGPAIVTDIAPPKERGKFMGIIAISVSVALATGPVLGGFLTTYFSWQSIFYINIPIGILGYLWAIKVIPNSKSNRKQKFDIVGAVTVFVALILFLLSLNYTEELGWTNIYLVSTFIGSILIFIFFIWYERKVEDPMIDLSIFKNRLFSMGNFTALLSFVATFFVILIMPFYLQQLLELSPAQAGFLFIPMPLTSLVIAPISGTLSDKIDTRYISSLGMFFMAFGMWQLSQLEIESSKLSIIIAMITVGFGSGLFQTPNNSAVMGSVPKNRLGIASSMLATMRNMGMVLGVAMSGAIFSSRLSYLKETLSTTYSGIQLKNEAFLGALNSTFLIASGIALVAVFTSLIRGSLNK